MILSQKANTDAENAVDRSPESLTDESGRGYIAAVQLAGKQ
jgi:hypothetical protein